MLVELSAAEQQAYDAIKQEFEDAAGDSDSDSEDNSEDQPKPGLEVTPGPAPQQQTSSLPETAALAIHKRRAMHPTEVHAVIKALRSIAWFASSGKKSTLPQHPHVELPIT